MSELERVKIVVAGDSGVGKSALVHLLSYQEPLHSPAWTVGCSVEVKVHDYRAGTPHERPILVELWDIGGSSNHSNARGIFYQNLHGMILVHDVSNKKSEQNLHRWMDEIMDKTSLNILESVSDGCGHSSGDFSLSSSNRLPALVIANKMDLADEETARKDHRQGFASEMGLDEIRLACDSDHWFAAGSGNAVLLDRFYDKVVNYRESSKEYPTVQPVQTINPAANRRHINIPMYKSGHSD